MNKGKGNQKGDPPGWRRELYSVPAMVLGAGDPQSAPGALLAGVSKL